MKPFILMQLLKSAMLVDVTALTYKGNHYVMSAEHSYNMVGTDPTLPIETVSWRAWGFDKETGGFTDVSQSALNMPVAHALGAVVMSGDTLVLLAEVNRGAGGYLMHATPLSAKPLLFAYEHLPTSAVSLSVNEARKVQLPPEQTWHSADLPCERWLFNPHLSAAGAGEMFVSFNTADAQAWVQKSDALGAQRGTVALLPNLLEPKVQRAGSRTLLFARQTVPPWSVYFHTQRYSTKHGPVALPLVRGEIDGSGRLKEVLDLSVKQKFGAVFAFAAASDGERLALGLVRGTKEIPTLGLYVSGDGGETWKLEYETSLRRVPQRVTLTIGKSSALIAVTSTGPEHHEVEAAECPL